MESRGHAVPTFHPADDAYELMETLSKTDPVEASGLIRIAIIDDDADLLRLLQTVLASTPGFAVPQVFSDSKTAFRKLSRTRIDMALVDLTIPGDSGLRLIRKFVESGRVPHVVAFTSSDDEVSVLEALRAGAQGYWVKSASLDELVEAMQRASRGEPMLSRVAYQAILSRIQGPARPSKFQNLSKTETNVLALTADGLSCGDISKRLQVSVHTIYVHNKRILKKLGVESRSAAIALFREQAESFQT